MHLKLIKWLGKLIRTEIIINEQTKIGIFNLENKTNSILKNKQIYNFLN